VLERHFPEIGASQPEVPARHCSEAGLAEQAIGYWVKAGQQSLARSAAMEAAAQLRELLRDAGDSAAAEVHFHTAPASSASDRTNRSSSWGRS
jgi:predicted ATPase